MPPGWTLVEGEVTRFRDGFSEHGRGAERKAARLILILIGNRGGEAGAFPLLGVFLT